MNSTFYSNHAPYLCKIKVANTQYFNCKHIIFLCVWQQYQTVPYLLYAFFWVIPRQTLGNHPKESIQHSVHGKSLKSRVLYLISLYDLITFSSFAKDPKKSSASTPNLLY